MVLTNILGSDSVKNALKTKANAGFDDTDTNTAEIVAARDSEASLLAQIDALQASIAVLVATSACPVSADDTTPGYLDGKLLAGEGIDFTVGSPAGNETLTIAGEDASTTNKGLVEIATTAEVSTGTDALRPVTPATLTQKFAAPGAIGETTPSTGRFTLQEIVKTTSTVLTAAECSGTMLNNRGQTTTNTLTLCTVAEGLSGILMVGTAGAGALYLKAGASDKIYFDGTALDDADKVSCATPAVGNFITFWAFETGASAWDWIVETGRGTWADGGA